VSLPIIQLREEDYGRENMDRWNTEWKVNYFHDRQILLFILKIITLFLHKTLILWVFWKLSLSYFLCFSLIFCIYVLDLVVLPKAWTEVVISLSVTDFQTLITEPLWKPARGFCSLVWGLLSSEVTF
jgi:hypothetical protein